MKRINDPRELDGNGRRHWFLHKDQSYFIEVLLIIWGIALICLITFEKNTPLVVYIPVCYFASLLIFYGVFHFYEIYRPPNFTKTEFNPKEKYNKIMSSTIFVLPLIVGGPILCIISGITDLVIFIASIIFCLFTSYMVYLNVREAAQFYRISKKYGASTINQMPSESILGEAVSIEFYNNKLAAENFELTVCLLNISERIVKTGSSGKDKKFVAIARYEEEYKFIFDESGKSVEFFLETSETFPTRFGAEPDYWEVQFKHEASEFFARFILDIQEKHIKAIPEKKDFL